MGLADKSYIVMYDVRGIQDYIFKTNHAKEIVGASCLVDSIIIKGLEEYVNEKENEQNRYMTDWENDDGDAFLTDSSVVMQVMFIGGGNAYVLIRGEEACHDVNWFLSKYVLTETYSLNLAVAVIEKGESYAKDYENINAEMRRIKAKMPNARPTGALPFMKRDSITGYPISRRVEKYKAVNYYCTEAVKKRSKFSADEFSENEGEKIFDNMVTEKGDNSSLAICHIDGNSMGMRIREQMKNVKAYEEAISKMRTLSKDIANSFRDTFDKMIAYMDELTPKVKPNSKHKLYREIIVAGDDITFVCNAKLARSAVEFFLKQIVERGYSACAGIAYFNSHFPFSDAYKVTEACCETAKRCAKENGHRGKDGSVGCYMDFQICTNVRAANLGEYRKKHYLVNGEYMIARPYYVPSDKEGWEEMNSGNQCNSIDRLEQWLIKFDDKTFIARNKAKKLRNIIPEGLDGIKSYLLFLKYRGIELDRPEEQYRYWYDALEIMDIDLIPEKIPEKVVSKEGATDENKDSVTK